MQTRKILMGLAVALSLSCAQVSAVTPKGAKKAARQVTFKVRIENISSPEGQAASDGTRWPFALSPGLYVVNEKGAVLFREGHRAGAGLEAQAEDGNAEALAKSFESMNREAGQHGIFNMPAGAGAPGPIGPGAAYEFTLSAAPKMKLTLVTMFGQSNDYFYATEKPVELFDAAGEPLSGDITARFALYDAGTEVNQEPGVGTDQAPRQKAPNTGAAEGGVVHRAKADAFYSKTGQLFRVTVTPVN
ncbi:MAG: spondin domain-containing protein [Acidobacteria bacterium]|nr:spondin domain-containing protein [Acidobacteriota bacterium]